MSSIILKRLLGTESVGGSRSVINSNSEITENSINLLKDYIDTDIAGGKLTVGNILVPLGANAPTDVLFTVAGSGSFGGNLTIAGNLDVTSETTWTGPSLFKNTVIFDGSAGSPSLLTLGGNGAVDFEQLDGLFVETQFSTSIPLIASAVTGAGFTFTPSATARVIYLDYTNYVDGDGTNGAYNVQLPAGTKVGEKMYIRPNVVHENMCGGNAGDGVIITNVGIHTDWENYSNNDSAAFQFKTPAADTGLPIADQRVTIQRQWIELVYTSGGWALLNAHPEVFNIV